MKLRPLFFVLIGIAGLQTVFAHIELPNIFSNHMVLQRNAEVLLWGWGAPNETVKVYTGWDRQTYELKTGVDAKWSFTVRTLEAGGPFQIRFSGASNEVVLEDVLIGEVWLCSGQSNMEWSANSGIDNAASEIAMANYPDIRLFTVAKRTSKSEQEDVSGTWEACTPETMADFSAAAYFFSRRLRGELNVPIGMVDASWGASSAEVWTPSHVFKDEPDLAKSAEKIRPNKWVSVEPSSLYNAMIAPLHPYKIAGALWYQGESNTANGERYQKLFTTMITSWRAVWGYNFPFYYVQIAPYQYGGPEEGVVVRNQQRKSLELPDTGMVVTSDIATVDDIHPQNKQDVGLRLANIALKEHYKVVDMEVYGPLFREIKIEGSKVAVYFDHANGLKSKTKKITQFEVAAADGVFYPAKAKIKDDMVVVSSKKVKEPTQVRFAWGNTKLASLFNSAGLPASSFVSE